MSGPASATAKLVEALDRAEDKVQESARRLARLPAALEDPRDEVNLSEEIVNLMHARNSYEANLKALRTVDEIEGHLIDVLG